MAATPLAGFVRLVQERTGEDFGPYGAECYRALHRWSVENPEAFWNAVWDYCGVIGEKGGTVVEKTQTVPWARFFPDSKLSYAENMLRHALANPDAPAIIYRHQDGPDRVLSGRELCESVSRWEQALRAAGLKEGDAIGVYLTNVPETVILLLAAANIGALFCSAGMEMGGDDLIDRFSRISPKILVAAKSYRFADKTIDRQDVVARAQKDIPSIHTTVWLENAAEFLQPYKPEKLSFIRRDFNHPLYVLFSSGTTGAPKGFVHGAGGILLKHLAEIMLQADVRPGDRLFFHATPSWMMWNWLASGLACGAAILQYDGSPSFPAATTQIRFSADHRCTHHGTAAPLIVELWMAQQIKMGKDFDLSPLRSVMYSAAVLPPQGYDFICSNIKKDVQVCGLSGGTDLVGCFIFGNPFTPVHAGQVAGPVLGMDVQIWNDDGKPVQNGQAGELVCANAFPSMPLRFVDDADGARYCDSYFNYYPGRHVWRHGDSVQTTPEGQWVIIGRSDATLNQNGVRIGPIKIYEQLKPERIGAQNAALIRGYTAVDFMTPGDKQAKTVLFLQLDAWQDGVPEDLAKAVKKAVKDNVGPYSVPSEIVAVPGVLKTKNGKLAEVVTGKIINGKAVKNTTLYGEDLVKHYEELHRVLTERYA